MSRIGKKPVAIPSGVKVNVADREISVEGKLGKLQYEHRTEVTVNVDEQAKQITVSRHAEDRNSRAYHGLTRALLQNMMVGVTQGYERRLDIVGVGYLAAIEGDTLQLRVGFANEIHKKIPPELDVTVPDQTHIVVRGCDKQKVGQVAAEIRAYRPPEPYKGKGVKYADEMIVRKEAKKK